MAWQEVMLLQKAKGKRPYVLWLRRVIRMPRRRVFKSRAECPGISTDLGPTCNQRQMIGRMVTLEKSSSSGVNITLDGAIVGQLDAALGSQVAAAIDRGQSFTAVIEKAYPIYNDQFKP